MFTDTKMNIANHNQITMTEISSKEADAGVKKIEAVTLTWSRTELNLAYGWCVFSHIEAGLLVFFDLHEIASL